MKSFDRAASGVLLIAIGLWLLVGVFLWLHLTAPSDGARLQPDQSVWKPQGVVVTPLEGRGDGLHTGDVVVTVEGRSLEFWAQALFRWDVPRPQWRLGQKLAYTIQRDGQDYQIPIMLAPYPLAAIFQNDWGALLFALINQFVAAFVFFKRPTERPTQVLFLGAASMVSASAWSFGLTIGDLVSGLGFWLFKVTTFAAYLLVWIMALHFALIFPRPRPILLRWRWVIPALYLIPYAIHAVYFPVSRLASTNTLAWFSKADGDVGVIQLVYLSLTLVVAVTSYRAAREPVSRAQIRWVFYAFVVVFALAILFAMLPELVLGHPFVSWNGVALFGLLVPLAIAFAILRYHLFDIDVIINRTLVYGALTALIIGMYIFIVGGLGALLQTSNPLAPLLFTAVISAVFFQPLRARLQRAADNLILVPTSGATAAIPRGAPPAVDPARAELGGRWLVVARIVWLTLAALAVLILLASIPAYVTQLGTLTPAERLRLAVAGQPLTNADPLEFWLDLANMIGQLVSAAACLILAAVIFWRRSNEHMAFLLSFFLLVYGIVIVGPLQTLAEFRADWLAVVSALEAILFAGWAALFYLFPDGQFTPAWTRWLTLALIPWLLITLFFRSYLIATTASQPGPNQVMVLIVWYMIWPVTSLVAQVHRYRRVSNLEQRQQTKWVLLAFGLFVLVILSLAGPFVYFMLNHSRGSLAGMPALSRFYGPLWSTLVSVVPLSMGFAILRYHLFDIDLLIHRTVVYGALTAMVVGLYVLAVGVLSALFQTSGSFVISLLATGLVAILFQPLRERLQRAVNRLIYGERDDPYGVLSRLGQRLEATLAPEAVLPTLAETIAQTLKLPYVAIALQHTNGSEPEIAAAYGLPSGPAVSLPLTYQSERVGELLIALRAPDEAFTPAEQRLLTDIAHQAGVAVHNVRLTADLQRSRERLVTAREEERRRLRRDLHDGLGPALASLTLKLDAARNLLSRDPVATEALLLELKSQTQTAIADIRRLVYDLRPPALDELGLVSALQEYAARDVSANGLRVSVEAPDHVPPLPAAVEVAVYRIALEALTNVVRHAHAQSCLVRLSLPEVGDHIGGQPQGGRPQGSPLQIEIIDDGIGLPVDYRVGVGLTSVRERAAELGGTCAIGPGPGGGTRVAARLPLSQDL